MQRENLFLRAKDEEILNWERLKLQNIILLAERNKKRLLKLIQIEKSFIVKYKIFFRKKFKTELKEKDSSKCALICFLRLGGNF